MLRRFVAGTAALAIFVSFGSAQGADEAKPARKPEAGQASQVGQAGAKGAERGQRAAEFMKKFDTNGDGKLDETERAAAMKAFPGRRPGQPGAGKPGEGKPGERARAGGPGQGRGAEMLKRFDKNGDGKLDEAERAAAMKELGGRRPGAGAGKPGEGKPGAGQPGAGRGAELLKRFDKNGDGKLDDAEKEAAKKELGGRRRPTADKK